MCALRAFPSADARSHTPSAHKSQGTTATMAAIAQYLGTGALAHYVEDFEAENLSTPESLFALQEASSLDQINRAPFSFALLGPPPDESFLYLRV